MNNNVKIHLTIEMESGALVRKGFGQEYSVNPDAIELAKKEGINLPTKYTHRNLVNKPSFKVVQINQESYDWFRSYESMPNGYKSVWRNSDATKRLEIWLGIICADNRGKSFTYQILED